MKKIIIKSKPKSNKTNKIIIKSKSKSKSNKTNNIRRYTDSELFEICIRNDVIHECLKHLDTITDDDERYKYMADIIKYMDDHPVDLNVLWAQIEDDLNNLVQTIEKEEKKEKLASKKQLAYKKPSSELEDWQVRYLIFFALSPLIALFFAYLTLFLNKFIV